jgi:hypothetical protein
MSSRPSLEEQSVPSDGGSAEEKTLRDYFAGQALIGVIAATHLGDILKVDAEQLAKDVRSFARHAYAIADAMIAERSVPIRNDERRRLVAALRSRRHLVDGIRLTQPFTGDSSVNVMPAGYAEAIVEILSKERR